MLPSTDDDPNIRVLAVSPCEMGGSQVWAYATEPAKGAWARDLRLFWTEGWYTPAPTSAIWDTARDEWRLIGHKLIDTESQETYK